MEHQASTMVSKTTSTAQWHFGMCDPNLSKVELLDLQMGLGNTKDLDIDPILVNIADINAIIHIVFVNVVNVT